jgi:small subunit ribosomal protein S17
MTTAAVEVTEQQKSKGQAITGRVVSNKMDKTIVVEVERKVKHEFYGKYIRLTSRVKAHDADNSCNIGDLVTVVSCRPLSKTKHWVLSKILEQAEKDITQ